MVLLLKKNGATSFVEWPDSDSSSSVNLLLEEPIRRHESSESSADDLSSESSD